MEWTFVALLAIPLAAPPAKPIDIGPITVRVDGPAGVVPLADPFAIAVTLTLPERVELKPPAIGDRLGGCKVLEVRRDGPDLVAGQFARLVLVHWTVRLEPMSAGKLELGELELSYRDGGEWTPAKIPLPAVEVNSALPSTVDVGMLRPAPELPGSAPANRHWSWWLRWTGVSLAMTALVAWILSRQLPSAVESPLEKALARLERLESNQEAPPRRRIFASADAVREYLQVRYALPVARQTTPEFLADPRTAAALDANQRDHLQRFLESADERRFAGREPTPADWSRCLQHARQLLSAEAGPAKG